MTGHRSQGRQGKAAMAGTKDYGKAYRDYRAASRAIYLKYGLTPPEDIDPSVWPTLVDREPCVPG